MRHVLLAFLVIGVAAETERGYANEHTPPPTMIEDLKKAGVEFVRIKGGTAWLGSQNEDVDEWPLCRVSVGDFEIMKAPLTVAQYRTCVENGPCRDPSHPSCNYGKPGFSNHPVNCISYLDGMRFARWSGLRIPSEAEWEFAASSGVKPTAYPWGREHPTCERAHYSPGGTTCSNGKGRTAAVCTHPAGNTADGLCDMAGNVWEWTTTTYHHDLRRPGYCSDSMCKTLKGGNGFSTRSKGLRTANKVGHPTTFEGPSLGIRFARGPRPKVSVEEVHLGLFSQFLGTGAVLGEEVTALDDLRNNFLWLCDSIETFAPAEPTTLQIKGSGGVSAEKEKPALPESKLNPKSEISDADKLDGDRNSIPSINPIRDEPGIEPSDRRRDEPVIEPSDGKRGDAGITPTKKRQETLHDGQGSGEQVSSMFGIRGWTPKSGIKELADSWSGGLGNQGSDRTESGTGIKTQACTKSNVTDWTTPAIEEIHSSLLEGKEISDALLTKAFIDLDVFRYRQCSSTGSPKLSTDAIVSRVQATIAAAQRVTDPAVPESLGRVKSAILGRPAMKYELAHRRVSNLVVDNLLNCESASNAVILAWLSGRKGASEPRPVFLYTPGHVQPGLYESNSDVIYFTEATAKGTRVALQELPARGYEYQVVDARMLLLGSVAELREDTWKVWREKYQGQMLLFHNDGQKASIGSGEETDSEGAPATQDGEQGQELILLVLGMLFLGGLVVVISNQRKSMQANSTSSQANMDPQAFSWDHAEREPPPEYEEEIVNSFFGGISATVFVIGVIAFVLFIFAVIWSVTGILTEDLFAAAQFVGSNIVPILIIGSIVIFGAPMIARAVNKNADGFAQIIGSIFLLACILAMVILVFSLVF